MTKKSAIAVIPVFLSFFVMGFVDIVGISTAYVKDDFQLSNTAAQLLPMMVFVWFALLSVPVGILQDKYGKKNMLNIGIAITVIAMLVPIIEYTFPIVLISFILIGIGNTIIQVSANPLLHDVSSKKAYSSNMSLSQFIKAIASLLGPIITTFVATQFGNWKLIFIIYSVTSFLAYLWLRFTFIEESKPERDPASIKSCLLLLKNKFVLLMVIAILLIVGIDVGMNTNIALVLMDKYGISTAEASIGIKIYFVALIISRFIGAMLLRTMEPKKFLLISVIISIIGFFGLMISPSLLLSEVSVLLIGLGIANTFPVIFAATVERMPDRSNEISGLMIMSVCGGAVFPFIMGVVSDAFSSLSSMFVLIGCVAYVLFASLYILKQA
jgi:fucose permease